MMDVYGNCKSTLGIVSPTDLTKDWDLLKGVDTIELFLLGLQTAENATQNFIFRILEMQKVEDDKIYGYNIDGRKLSYYDMDGSGEIELSKEQYNSLWNECIRMFYKIVDSWYANLKTKMKDTTEKLEQEPDDEPIEKSVKESTTNL